MIIFLRVLVTDESREGRNSGEDGMRCQGNEQQIEGLSHNGAVLNWRKHKMAQSF